MVVPLAFSVSAPIATSVNASQSPSAGHVVAQGHVAVPEPGAGIRQQVRRQSHRLHAAGHHGVELPGPDQLVGQRDGVQPGQAHLVDGEGGHVHADPAGHGGLPGGDLPAPGLQHLAHDHVVDVGGCDPGTAQGAADRDAAEFRRRQLAEGAGHLAHRGAGVRRR